MFFGSHALLILAVTASPTLWSLNSRERTWVSLNLHLWLPFSLACESLEVRDYCHPHRCLRYIIESDSWWVLSKYLLKEQMDGWMDGWMDTVVGWDSRKLSCLLFMCVSCSGMFWLFTTLQTVACQAPLSMEFSKQEYWSESPFHSSGNLPDLGVQPWSPAL